MLSWDKNVISILDINLTNDKFTGMKYLMGKFFLGRTAVIQDFCIGDKFDGSK